MIMLHHRVFFFHNTKFLTLSSIVVCPIFFIKNTAGRCFASSLISFFSFKEKKVKTYVANVQAAGQESKTFVSTCACFLDC